MQTASISKTCLLLPVLAVLVLFPAAALQASDAASPKRCTIQKGSCSITTASGMIVGFDIQPKPVKALSQLQYIVTLNDKGKAVTDASVGLDLTMAGMYMGKNAPAMKHVSKGRYEGSGVITRCMSGRKTWQADVTVVRDGARETASFLFEVQ